LLPVNGIQPAFGIGSAWKALVPMKTEQPIPTGKPTFRTRWYSGRKDVEVVRHTLIDCGMGVVPSLLKFEHRGAGITVVLGMVRGIATPRYAGEGDRVPWRSAGRNGGEVRSGGSAKGICQKPPGIRQSSCHWAVPWFHARTLTAL
jgi:hypothetical protein